jgi:signal transduction histidine kinase
MNQKSLSREEEGFSGKGMEILKLDDFPGKEMDDITRLAAIVTKSPVSMICLAEGDDLQVVSSFGANATLNAATLSFCKYTMEGEGLTLVVPDAREDDRFRENPLVIADPCLVFYAGVALVTSDGSRLGTLFVADQESHKFWESETESLLALGNLASKLLEESRQIDHMRSRVKSLEEFTTKAAHNIKSPLCSISMMTELFREQYAEQMDPDGIELLTTINVATVELAQSIDDILHREKKSAV